MEKEIIRKGRLLRESGKLDEAGWARSLIKTYKRRQVKAGRLRMKEWDYYLITDGKRGIAMTIADNGYMGMYSVSWLDFEVPEETTKSVMTVLPMGRTEMPSDSSEGDSVFLNDRLSISFRHEGENRRLRCLFYDFKDGKALEADLVLSNEPDDSIVVMSPYPDDEKALYYNQKINCLKAEGTVRLGTDVYHFSPESASGCLDWGRGVWTYSNTWYWASASGVIDGHDVGFNLGYGFGDTSAASENAFFLDGKIHKLDRIEFRIPRKAGKDEFMTTWKITSNDGRFEASFKPLIDRSSHINAGLIESDQHQVFGRFTGRVILDDGSEMILNDFFGFAEKVKNRW